MTSPTQVPPSESPARASTAEALVRRLGKRYLLVLAVVAGLIVIDQAIIQPLLVRMDSYAPVINLAGRQRMLSQKLAKAALAVEVAPDATARDHSRRELEAALAEWIEANDALRFGKESLKIPRIASAELTREWVDLDRDFRAIITAADKIVASNDQDSSASATILLHESLFLKRMERIVDLFELEAATELSRLRIYSLAISAAVIALLVLLGWMVVRPATRAIRRQVDDLEMRVSQRTAELANVVASLRHEVAERELAETRSQRLAVQLAHADRVASMGHFAVGLAHELNQPLGAIANYSAASEVIISQSDAQDDHQRLKEYLAHIGQAALRAGEIVRRIRKFIVRRSGDVSDAAEIDLAALVREILELCQFEIRRSDVAVTIELSQRPAIVKVDAIQIQQVLVNLVQNALQSMQSCPADSRRLAIQLIVNDDRVEVSVIDSGPGFDAEDLDAPFAAFHTTKTEGLGVGLSICRTIIEGHAGTIAIKPTTAGAHICFTLPLSKTPQFLPPNDSSRFPQSELVCR